MTKNKRCFQHSAVNYDLRMDGGLILHSCFRCSHYGYPVCKNTNEDIKYPVSGPVGKHCPLPKYEIPKED
jgi:hypothetical protein